MWKDIDFPGYEEFKDIYAVNECGYILNKKTGKLKIPAINNKGYLYVYLYNNYYHKHILIHRAVALAFIPNPNNYPCVLHLDNDTMHCHVSNLKWGTYKENNKQIIEDGHYVTHSVPRLKYTIYDPNNGNTIDTFIGVKEAADAMQYSIGSIYSASIKNSTLRQGPYKGFKIRSEKTTKPFTIHNSYLDKRSTIIR